MLRLPILPTRLRNSSTSRSFTVLALESSADDTCAAVVTSSRKILSNVVVKQNEIHEITGGIHPAYANQCHQREMPGAIRRALTDARLTVQEIDGIAYTRGPGMAGCLSVGSNMARGLAAALYKPLVGVHHMQAHALTPLLTEPVSDLPHFPFLTLLISGGHTLLLLATSLTSFRILATTPDESIGRAFDKVSRHLCLKWTEFGPGAALEQFCAQEDDGDINSTNVQVPQMTIPNPRQLMFSFAGLHSTVERYIFDRGGIQNLDTTTRRALARSFQNSAVAQLEEKLALGFKLCERKGIKIRHLIVSGGVASNFFLRARLKKCLENFSLDKPISLTFPPPLLCTDNAAMIAWASMHRFLAQDYDDYSLDLRAKWSIEDLSDIAS